MDMFLTRLDSPIQLLQKPETADFYTENVSITIFCLSSHSYIEGR